MSFLFLWHFTWGCGLSINYNKGNYQIQRGVFGFGGDFSDLTGFVPKFSVKAGLQIGKRLEIKTPWETCQVFAPKNERSHSAGQPGQQGRVYPLGDQVGSLCISPNIGDEVTTFLNPQIMLEERIGGFAPAKRFGRIFFL